MHNKPKYTLWKNSGYALSGLREIWQNESSFKLQVSVFILFNIIALLMPLDTAQKAILMLSLFLPIIAEVINSAIERIVDLITDEYHELAKQAKDAGAAAVFLSIILTTAIWISVISIYWGE